MVNDTNTGCIECSYRGWALFESDFQGLLVQRCDACGYFVDDDEAGAAAQRWIDEHTPDLEDDGPWTRERVSNRYRAEIPDSVLEALNHFVLTGRRPGSFANAVLENDLRYAFGYADRECRAALPLIVEYLHNRLPSACWGSKAHVREWEGCEESELETDSLVWPEGSR